MSRSPRPELNTKSVFFKIGRGLTTGVDDDDDDEGEEEEEVPDFTAREEDFEEEDAISLKLSTEKIGLDL